jgi:hypothetical protein
VCVTGPTIVQAVGALLNYLTFTARNFDLGQYDST